MKYNPNAPKGIEVTFKDEEVDTIRSAFQENIERLRSLGNDGSVSEYQQWVASWEGSEQTYKAARISQLIEPLQYFIEVTEERVDQLLDEHSPKTRIQAAAKRYELGYNAEVILTEIEQTDTGEAVGPV